MSFSRRSFLKWASALSTLGVVSPGHAEGVARGALGTESKFRPDLLPSQKEVWDILVWMAKLGPKYTGNKAHVEYID
jgi:hypothetical protein